MWSYVSDSDVEPAVVVDDTVATAEVNRLLAGKTGGPVEPSFAQQGGKLVAVAGHPGLGIETPDVVAGLHSLRYSKKDMKVEVASHTVQPKYSVDDAQKLVDEANELTSQPIEVKAGEMTTSLDVPTLRSFLVGKAGADGLTVGLDPTVTSDALAKQLAAAATPPQDASISIVNGVPTPAPGHPGAKCCAPTAPDVLFAALHARPTGPVDLPLEEVPPALSTDQLNALGLKEVVATFTTKHKAGEARVTNIHRMADLVRGTIIRPGEVFSINQLVGQRTEEKGFVFAPAIAEGVHEDEVGGGVSQFATTLFNASFFAGLDFVQYQSHSLYISRYPYGREATLGWPGPDLQIRNTTPYGILIWPSYTKIEPHGHVVLDEVLLERRPDEPDVRAERRVHVGRHRADTRVPRRHEEGRCRARSLPPERGDQLRRQRPGHHDDHDVDDGAGRDDGRTDDGASDRTDRADDGTDGSRRDRSDGSDDGVARLRRTPVAPGRPATQISDDASCARGHEPMQRRAHVERTRTEQARDVGDRTTTVEVGDDAPLGRREHEVGPV